MQVHFRGVVNYVKSWSASVYLKKKKPKTNTHIKILFFMGVSHSKLILLVVPLR